MRLDSLIRYFFKVLLMIGNFRFWFCFCFRFSCYRFGCLNSTDAGWTKVPAIYTAARFRCVGALLYLWECRRCVCAVSVRNGARHKHLGGPRNFSSLKISQKVLEFAGITHYLPLKVRVSLWKMSHPEGDGDEDKKACWSDKSLHQHRQILCVYTR